MSGWWGFDFDGTLAEYDTWKGASHVGAPVKKMCDLVRMYLKQGRDVRIFTARIAEINSWESVHAIEAFCQTQFGTRLSITCCKDMHMVALFDDRCTQVEPNTGELIEDKLKVSEAKVRALEAKLDSISELYYGDKEDSGWVELGDILEVDA